MDPSKLVLLNEPADGVFSFDDEGTKAVALRFICWLSILSSAKRSPDPSILVSISLLKELSAAF